MRNPITTMMQEYDSVKKFNSAEEKAIKMFDLQADSIRNIRATDGYAAIKDFIRREKEAAIQRLTSTTKADLPEVRALLGVTDRLLNFLENREKDLQKPVS